MLHAEKYSEFIKKLDTENVKNRPVILVSTEEFFIKITCDIPCY